MKFRRRAQLSRSDLVGRWAYVYPDPSSSQPPLSEVARWRGKVRSVADDRSVDIAVVEPASQQGWSLRVTPRLPEVDLSAAFRGEEVEVDLLLAAPKAKASGGSKAMFRLTPRE